MIGQIGLAALFAQHPDWRADASPNYVQMAEAGARLPASTLWQILETVEQLRRDVSQLFTQVDLIVTPATAALPWPADEAFPPVINGQSVGPRGHAIFTGWVNAAGLPAVAMPCTPSRAGLPIGVQLISDYGSDDALLSLAADLEASAPQAWRWPTI